MKKWTTAAAVCALISIRVPAAAQDWANPYRTPGTLGALLETRFGVILQECGLPNGLTQWRPPPFRNRQKSSIPLALQRNLRLNARIHQQITSSAGRLLGYIFPNENVARTLAMPNQDRVLAGIDPAQEPLSMLDPGTSTLAYAHSCRSVIAAAISAQAGMSVPSAQIKAALESEFEQATTGTLIITEGQFRSPLAAALDNTADPADRIAARLLVWDWYIRNGVPPSPNVYIKSFRGGTIYSTYMQNRTLDGKLEIGAGANAPAVASVETSIRTALNLDSRINIHRFGTFHYIMAGHSDITVAQLPGPSTIAAEINSTVIPELQREPLAPLTDLATHLHYHEIAGVPVQLCNLGSWDLHPPEGQTGTLTLESVARDPARTRVCRFTVSYRLQTVPAADVIRIQYDLVSRAPVGGVRLQIPVRPVELNTLAGPVIRPEVFNPRWHQSGENIEWTVPIRIADAANVINFGRDPVVVDDALICDNTPVRTNPPGVTVQGRTVTLTLVRPVAGTPLDLTGLGKSCTWTAALVFTTVTDTQLRRAIQPLEILFPGPLRNPARQRQP